MGPSRKYQGRRRTAAMRSSRTYLEEKWGHFPFNSNAIRLLFQTSHPLLAIREHAGSAQAYSDLERSSTGPPMGCTCQNSAKYTATELQAGFSRLMMNGLWHCALHSDKSCKPLCLMTLKRRPRSVHPSDGLRSSPSIGGSHPHQAMRGFTCPLPILNSLSIFFY